MEERRFNDAGYYQYLKEGRLMASRCVGCGSLFVPPRSLCTHCYGTRMDWVELSGKGKLAGFTTIYVGLSFMADVGFDREHPYSAGVIRLAEGTAVCGQILTPNGNAPDALHIGMPLQAAFVERSSSDQHIALAFKPVEPEQ